MTYLKEMLTENLSLKQKTLYLRFHLYLKFMKNLKY
nr:MAG TPA: hypothetical protein [Bacteriophage sp.]